MKTKGGVKVGWLGFRGTKAKEGKRKKEGNQGFEGTKVLKMERGGG